MISDPKGLMKLEFKCPECGGYRFGTGNAGDWDIAVGYCNTGNCNYQWMRKDDDKLGVFVQKEEQ